MRKFFKLLFSLIGIALIVCVFYVGYSNYLDEKIENLYREKEDLLSTYNIPLKNRGCAWIEKSANGDNIIVFGSSELNARVSQNIKNNFPNDRYQGNISCIGTRHVQNLLHSIDIGANYKAFDEKNIVLIESMQWFYGEELKTDGFMANFSEIQFYKFMRNDLISKQNKKYLCKRFLELEKVRTCNLKKEGKDEEYDYPKIHLLAKLYSSDNLLYKISYQLMRPYYYIEYKMLSLKDKYNTYEYLKDLKIKHEKPEFTTDWDMQLKKATAEGEEACTNNDLFVSDVYYNKYFKDKWASFEGKRKDTPLLKCNEWKDYEFILSVCKELGFKPYIINVSCNPRYYDYVGITKDKRDPYYERISDIAKQYDMPIYNGFIPREDEPYIYCDVMHLGWKGWIYVTEAVVDHFTGAR